MLILTLGMLFLPLAAAIALLLLDPQTTAARARGVALTATIVTFILSLAVGAQFQKIALIANTKSPVQPRWESRHTWLTIAAPQAASQGGNSVDQSKPIRLEFYLGMDGISVAMILLTTLLCIPAVLISWTAVEQRAGEFYAALLVLETGMLGVFLAFDVVLFYVFFEFTLIPMFLMIGVWGGPQRRYAANKFFLYTLAGSMITLVGIVGLVLQVRSLTGIETPFSIPDLARALQAKPLPDAVQGALFLAIAAGFLVKVPVFPFHTWLPLAHVEAPTAGSVLLAGVLLKLGTYGFLRLCLPLLPAGCLQVGQPLIALLAVIGIVHGSLCSLVQNDIKKLVAYSSVAHLGFAMLGLFALNPEGITGGILQMINHGLSTGALFLIVGMFYERYHTRMLDDLGGLAQRLPLMATGLVFISFASIGLPGLNGFAGELLCLAGMFKANPVYAAIGATGVILGAWYLLGMLQHAFFGPLKEPHQHGGHHEPIRDISVREGLGLIPLAFLCLWFGVFPQTVVDLIQPDVHAISRLYENLPTDMRETDVKTARLEHPTAFDRTAEK